MGANPSNETGHWESDSFVHYHDTFLADHNSSWMDWQPLQFGGVTARRSEDVRADIRRILNEEYGCAPFIVLKDPRICRFAPLFLEALDDEGLDTRVVLQIRNPVEVSRSLEERDGISLMQAALLWLRHVLEAEAATRDRPRSIVTYDLLLSDWRSWLDQVAGATGIEWPNKTDEFSTQFDEFVRADLRHHESTLEDVLRDPVLRNWLGETYGELLALSQNPQSAARSDKLDAILGEFNRACPILRRWREDETAKLAAMQDTLAAAANRNEELTDQLAVKQGEILTAETQLADLKNEYDAACAALSEARAWATSTDSALAETKQSLVQLETDIKSLISKTQSLSSELTGVYETYSWRATAPLRSLARHLQNRTHGTAAALQSLLNSAQAAKSATSTRLLYLRRQAYGRAKRLASRAVTSASSIAPGGARPQESEEGGNAQAGAGSASPIMPSLEADHRIEALSRQLPIKTTARNWGSAPPKRVLRLAALKKRIARIGGASPRKVILSVTHDDYRKVIGGVQLCVQLEEHTFVEQGALYLNIHPHQALPILSDGRTSVGFICSLIVNGQTVGATYASTLIELIEGLVAQGARCDGVIHAMLGHSPEVLIEIMAAARVSKGVFWVHDFFTACPGTRLLRNEIVFCNAPPPGSPACAICVYGQERQAHLARVAALFQALQFDVVAPSEHALALWKQAVHMPHASTHVRPHTTIKPGIEVSSSAVRKGPVRVAFLGGAYFFKGRHIFSELSKALADDPRYEFHLFGQEPPSEPNVRFTQLQVSAKKRDAMTTALRRKKVDVALLWSICPETFSFTLNEALAANLFVLTNPDSGNIHAVAQQRDDCRVLDNLTELVAFLQRGELETIVAQRRNAGRKVSELVFSDLSAPFFDAPGDAR